MPLDHSKATAKVSVTGLAIGCYNQTTNNWEVGLIRQPPHALRITVVKFADAENKSQAIFEFNKYEYPRILITAANAVVPAEPLYKRDPFDRLDTGISDPEDFRWIVDFETEFNNGDPVTVKKPENVEITELFVSAPVLYADQDDQLDDLKLLNIETQEKTDFGTLSEMCHGDITCNEGGAVILRIDGPLLNVSMDLPHIEGATHRILIENVCPPGQGGFTTKSGDERTDFNHYFSIVSLPGNDTFDLTSDEGLGSDAVCNPGHLSSTGSLLPMSSS